MLGSASPELIEELEFELDIAVLPAHLSEPQAVQEAFSRGARALIVPQPDGAAVYLPQGQRMFVPGRASEPRALVRGISQTVRPRRIEFAVPPPPAWRRPPQTAPPEPHPPEPPSLDWAALRRAQRANMPWRLRLAIGFQAVPRAVNGFGPYAGDVDGLTIYPGLALRFGVSRWVHPVVRIDGLVHFAYVFQDGYLHADHGPEGALGLAVMLSRPKRKQWAFGLGVEAMLAREVDQAELSHFGWLGFRAAAHIEHSWVKTGDKGLVLQFGPTLSYLPYYTGVYPGIQVSLGIEFGLGDSPD